MDLAKLVNEGFEVKAIRQQLDAAGVEYKDTDQSIVLLEKLASHVNGSAVSLSALRTVQRIRSKVKGHSGSSEADAIARDALATNGSFSQHFEFMAENVAKELEGIARLFQ
jgi:hypothetical protein